MITGENDWVPLTTAATRLGCTVKDIHQLVQDGAIPVEHERLNAISSMVLVRLKDIRAVRAHEAKPAIHDDGGDLPAGSTPINLSNRNSSIAPFAETDNLLDQLQAVAEHSLAQDRKLRAQTVQLKRVRTELEALRDQYQGKELGSMMAADDLADDRDRQHLVRFAHSHRRTHEALTRILDGQEENTDDK